MALVQAGMLPVGCSSQCARCVQATPTYLAYCSAQSIIVLKNSQAEGYRQYRVFGNQVAQPITSFTVANELVACVTAQNRMVVAWSMLNGDLLNKKMPSTVFKDDGPTSVIAPGAMIANSDGSPAPPIVIVGTTGGRVLAYDMAANTANGFTITSSGATTTTSTLLGSDLFSGGSSANKVECLAISSNAPQYGAVGTSSGAVAVFVMAKEGSSLSVRQHRATINPFAASKSFNASVADLSFDPHTSGSLVAAARDGSLAVCDAVNGTVTHNFDRHRYQITTVSWLLTQAGYLYTTDNQTNSLVLWSTASKTPVQTLRPVDDGTNVRASAAIPAAPGATTPGNSCFIGLSDGSVAVYELAGSQQITMSTPPSSSELLHDTRFSHHDKDVIATGGFDGMIRVWNIKRMSVESTIDAGRAIINSLDWNTNGKYIVAGLSNGEIAAFVTTTQKEHWRTLAFADPIWRVTWSTAESSMIAATSRIGVALLSAKDGKILRRIPTSSAALGVDFDPASGKLLVVGCQDGKVYVYNLAATGDTPLLKLSGHGDGVANVIFNPVVPSFIVSASHDCTLRVWDISSNDSHTASVTSRVLKGHADRVRGVTWCHCSPNLVLSGSTDNTVRLWDIRNGVAVTTIRTHNGEVVAIDSHPERPVLFVSTARDTTVQFWHMSLLRQVQLEAAMGTLEQCFVPDPTALMVVSQNINVNIISGPHAYKLLQELSNAATTPMQRLHLIAAFFEFPYGAADAVSCATHLADPNDTSADGNCTVIPNDAAASATQKGALASAEKARGKTVAAAGVEYRTERLIEAAEECLAAGKFQEACELFLEAEKWDRAIGAAPLVSRDYWKQTCAKAAAALAESGDKRAVQYFILAEDAERAAAFLASRGDHRAAAVVLQTCPQHTAAAAASPAENAGSIPASSTAKAQEHLLAAEQRISSGSNPRLAAATLFAVKKADEGIQRLENTGDVVLAHLLVHSVPVSQQETIDEAFRLSMLMSGRMRQWETMVQCASRQSNPHDALATAYAIYQHSQVRQLSSTNANKNAMLTEKVRHFFQRIIAEAQRLQMAFDAAELERQNASNGLASIKRLAAMVLAADGNITNVSQVDVATKPETLNSISGFMESIMQHVLTSNPDDANAPFYLKQAYQASGYVVIPVRLNNSSNNASGHGADQSSFSAEERKFLALCYLLAALMSVKVYRFPQNLNVAFTKAVELGAGHASIQQMAQQVQGHLGAYSPHSTDPCSATQQLGSGIPTSGMDGKMFTSVMTPGVAVDGPFHLLEDGSSLLSKGEAIAWFKCCWFSPLATGTRLIPF